MIWACLGRPQDGQWRPAISGRLEASHRTIAFGTKVRVTNIQTEEQVEVTMNDRGPKPKENLIDLSQAAAERLGLKKLGERQVRLEMLAPECQR
jgi:rare lipoprotein A